MGRRIEKLCCIIQLIVAPQKNSMLRNSLRARSILQGRSDFIKHRMVKAANVDFRCLQTLSSLDATFEESKGLCGVSTMPPGHLATTAQLKTFALPNSITGAPMDRELGRKMIDTWRTDGIFQISVTLDQENVLDKAFQDSKRFFQLPHHVKAGHVDSQSFAGYIASGEELTDGIADYSEIFTITKDLPEADIRVRSGWPCHGPCPWPGNRYERTMKDLMYQLGTSGEKILKLVALGLGLKNEDFFSDLTHDGWHHMRNLRLARHIFATCIE